MKAALAIKSNGPGHSFSLACSYFFRLHSNGEEQTICEAHSGIISATFQRIATQFIGPTLCSFYQMHGSSNTHWYQSSRSLLLWVSGYQSLHITIFTQAHLPGCQMWLVYCPSFIALPICLITFWYQSNLTENAFGEDLLLTDNGAPAFSTSYTCSLLFSPTGSSEYE